jgi:flagellar biogenesis protein FliO
MNAPMLCLLLAIGAGPPPAQPATATATTSDDDGYRTAREERAEASCCATLAREFGRTINSEERQKAIRDGRCCDLVAGEYERASAEPTDKPKGQTPSAEPKSLFQAIVQMVFVLGAICLLAYLVLGKMLPKLMRIEQPVAQRRIVSVIDRLPLDQRRSILVMRIGGLYFLVGVTEHGISLISRLDSDDVETALASAEAPRPTLGRLAGALLGRSQKESQP